MFRGGMDCFVWGAPWHGDTIVFGGFIYIYIKSFVVVYDDDDDDDDDDEEEEEEDEEDEIS